MNPMLRAIVFYTLASGDVGQVTLEHVEVGPLAAAGKEDGRLVFIPWSRVIAVREVKPARRRSDK